MCRSLQKEVALAEADAETWVEHDNAEPAPFTLADARAAMEKLAFFVGENRDSEGAPEMISKLMQQLNKVTLIVLDHWQQTSLDSWISSESQPGLVTRYSKSGDVLPASRDDVPLPSI